MKATSTAATSATTVPIADVAEDEAFQVRASVDAGTVKRYAEAMSAGAVFPPVRLAEITGALVLVDGWHRMAATRSLGHSEIEAEITHGCTPEQARWMAADANLRHGLPITSRADRERVFHMYIRAKRHRQGQRFKSLRDIAAELQGVASHNTINRWLKQHYPAIHREMRGVEPIAKGGLQEGEPADSIHLRNAREKIEGVAAAFKGISSPEVRGEVIQEMATALEALKKARRWTPYVPSEDTEDDF